MNGRGYPALKKSDYFCLIPTSSLKMHISGSPRQVKTQTNKTPHSSSGQKMFVHELIFSHHQKWNGHFFHCCFFPKWYLCSPRNHTQQGFSCPSWAPQHSPPQQSSSQFLSVSALTNTQIW